MAKVKIYELSKEIGVHSKDVVEFLKEKNVAIANHMSSIEDAEIAMVKKHFAPASEKPVEKPVEKKAEPVEEKKVATAVQRPQGQPMQRPQGQQMQRPQGQAMQRPQGQQMQRPQGQPVRQMLNGPEDRKKMQQNQGQPVRRMLDGPQDRRQTANNNGQQRRMLDGPQNGQKRPNNNQNRNGNHTINGVVISSDDGNNRLMRGSYVAKNDNNAINAQKAKELQARREAEKAEAARIAEEKEAEAERIAAQVRAEAQAIASDIEAKKAADAARAEAAKAAAEAKAAEAKAAEAAEEARKAAEAEAAKAEAEKPAEPEKKFKTLNNPVRPVIVSRAGADGVNRAAMGYDRRNDRDNRNGQGGGFNRDNRNGQGGGFNRDNRNGQGGGFNRDNRNGQGGGFNRDNRNGQGGQNRDNRNGGHFQRVDSKYNGDNNGHSNLFENQEQQNRFNNNQNRNNGGSRPNGGFSQNRNGGFGGGKDEDERKPVSHARDPKKKTGGAPEIDGSLKNNNQSRKGNKSKDQEKQNKRLGDFDEMGNGKKNKGKDPNRAGAFHRPEPVKVEVQEEVIKTITLPDVLTIQELADKMKIKGSDIVKKMFLAGKMVSLNSDITFEEAENIAIEYEIIAEHEEKVDKVAELLKEADEDESKLQKRPPVVCVMGHVDHGKTSLLDAIRTTNVTSREAGGITQHIGAYMVECKGEKITFLDTPGHEAFTAMRMRGANATDIAVLVVAADDGVMPQTVEAINHAKAAGIEIIVAVNKIDKPAANIDRVKQELTEYGLVSEDWGGSTVFVPVSAKTHQGIDQLLEMILLTSDVLELKANADRQARGIVIEAKLDKGRGPVATILVQKGTLKVGENVVIGSSTGKVRALVNDKGEKVKCATPSMPVEILGLNSVPDAGEVVVATASEKEARVIAEAYIEQNKEKLIAETKSKMSLDGLFSQIQAGNIKELNIIVKADVQGSAEAIKQSLLKLSNDEVAVRIIHGGVGAINESDATLASASNAIIIGFNVKPDNTAKDICDREHVDLRLYNVIYNAIDDVEQAMKGMLDPIFEEQVIGHAEVRMTFKASGVGIIAGSFVLDGKIIRGCKARITRGKDQIFEGNLASLKRFKDDVKEVAAGYECGLVFEKFTDLQEGDSIELYQMVEVPRK